MTNVSQGRQTVILLMAAGCFVLLLWLEFHQIKSWAIVVRTSNKLRINATNVGNLENASTGTTPPTISNEVEVLSATLSPTSQLLSTAPLTSRPNSASTGLNTVTLPHSPPATANVELAPAAASATSSPPTSRHIINTTTEISKSSTHLPAPALLTSDTTPIPTILRRATTLHSTTTHAPTKATLAPAAGPATPKPPILRHMNTTEIKKFFYQQPLNSFEQVSNLFPKPPIDDYDMVAVYSQKARLELQTMLRTQNVTLLANGGSSLTGAGFAQFHERCHSVFAQPFSNVTVVNRAHGFRNSFHSMQVMHSYYPTYADVVLWEFAINDAVYHIEDEKVASIEARNQFHLYMEQLVRVAKQRNQKPPLVILLYLWDRGFPMFSSSDIRNASIGQHAFEAHRHMAEQYDFVVGHVNAANYYLSWQLSEDKVRAIAFADAHHPNRQGHFLHGYLLHDLVTNDQRKEKPKHNTNQTSQNAFTWVCGNSTHKHRLVRDVMLNNYPVASFTAEKPRNDELLPGMLTPKDFDNLVLLTRGKVNILRDDRLQCVGLPCCNGTAGKLTFDVSKFSPLNGVQINFSPNDKGAEIWFDGENVTNELISAKPWKCLLSTNGGTSTFLRDWVVPPHPRNVSEISLCNSLPECGSDPNGTSSLAIMSFVVYGGKRVPIV